MEYHQLTIQEVLQEQESKRVFCRRCGRELKTADTKELGFGKTCYKKYMAETKYGNRKRLFDITILQKHQ